MDSNGLADPYVKLHLLPGASKVKDTSFLHFTSFLKEEKYPAKQKKEGGDFRPQWFD